MAWSREPGRRRGQPEAQRQRIMRRDAGICHVCHHPGSDNVDHIVNVKQWEREGREGSPHRDSNLAPIHQEPCQVCGRRCHVGKTTAEAQQARRVRRARPDETHPGLL